MKSKNEIRRSFGFIAACVLALTACQDENSIGWGYEPALTGHYLHLSSSSLSLAATAGSSGSVEVGCVGTPWQFRGMEKWLTASPQSGNTDSQVTFTAQENTSGSDARTSVFTFESTDAAFGYNRQLTVTQQAATPFVRPSKTAITFGAAGGTGTVTIEANINITLNNSASDWLSTQLSTDQRTLTLTTGENTTQQERSATISLGAGTTISILQAKPSTPIATPAQLTFPNTGGGYELSITSDVSWTATTSQSWLSADPAKGSGGTNKLTVSATANTGTADRPGFVYISIGSQQVLSISVVQRGIYIDVEPESLTFGVEGGSQSLTIQSNTQWQLLSMPSWLTAEPANGSGDATVTLTATANTTTSSQSGIIELARQGSTTALATVSVSQPARYFTLTPTTVNISHGSTGGTHQVHISTNSPWTAQSTTTWMQLSKSSGSGEQSIDVTLTTPDHPSITPREDRTTFSPSYGTPVTIVTNQAGRYLRTDPSELSAIMPGGGTSSVVTVSTDGTYTVTSSATAWLTINRTGNTFTYTATENTTGEDRDAVITVALTGLQSGEELKVELPVMQYATQPGVNIIPFGSEEQWDIITGTGANITVTGFGSDENWN